MRLIVVLIIIALAFYFYNKNRPMDKGELIEWLNLNVKVSTHWPEMTVPELQALYAYFFQKSIGVTPSQQVTDNVKKILLPRNITITP